MPFSSIKSGKSPAQMQKSRLPVPPLPVLALNIRRQIALEKDPPLVVFRRTVGRGELNWYIGGVQSGQLFEQ